LPPGWPTVSRDQQRTCGHADPFVERILGPQVPTLFWSLMGAVGFVVLIACSNATPRDPLTAIRHD
jgi:hypothetical protein